MSKMSIPSKGAVIVTILALTLSSFALTSAFAKGKTAKGPTTAAASTPMSAALMQNTWKGELSRLGFDNLVLGRIDKILQIVTSRFDKDTTSKRSDDRFAGRLELTLKEIQLLLAKAQAVASAHAGFDASGKVTDRAQALKSIQALGAYLAQLRGTLIYRLEHLARYRPHRSTRVMA